MTHPYSNSLSGQERSYRYDIDVILENYMPHPSTPTSSAMLKKQSRSHPRPTGASTSKSRPHTPPPADFYMKSGASPPSGSRKTAHGHSRGGSTAHVPSLSSVSAILSPRPMSVIDRSKMQEIASSSRNDLGKGDAMRDIDTGRSSTTVSTQRSSDKRASACPPIAKTKSSGTPSSRQIRTSGQGEPRRQRSSSHTNGRQSKSEPPSSADEDDESIHARLPIVEDI